MSSLSLKKKLLSKNENYITLLNIIGTLVYQGINFLLTPYLTRALNTHSFGIVSVYTSWVNILVPIVGVTSLAVIPHIKLYVEEKKQPTYLSSLLGLSMISFLIVFGISVALLPILSKEMELPALVIILLLLHSFGMATVNFAIAYCVQYQKTIFQFIITISLSIITSLISISLIKIIVNDELKYYGRVIGYSAPNFLVAIFIYFYFCKKGNHMFKLDVWKFAIPVCMPIIFHSLSNVLLSQSSRILLQRIKDFDIAGVFSFIYTIASLISVLWVALNNAWVPIYFQMLNDNKYDELYKRGKRYSFFFTAIFIGFMLVSPEILRIMGPKEYDSGIPIMPFISVSMYFMFMYSFSINFKTICKKTFSIATGTIVAALINIGVNIILIPEFGLWGAGIATLVSYIVLFLFHQLTVKKVKYEFNFTLKFYIPGLIGVLLSIAAFYSLFNFWYIRWALACIVGIVLLMRIIKQRAIF